MPLIDRHVLITGGSVGIGLAQARALIDAGAWVTICGRSPPATRSSWARPGTFG